MEFIANDDDATNDNDTNDNDTDIKTAQISLKTVKTTIQLTLPLCRRSTIPPSPNGPKYHTLPQHLQPPLSALRNLIDPHYVDPSNTIPTARLNLESWYRSHHPGYRLRHCIPRSLPPPEPSQDVVEAVRKSYPLQSPVLRFHIDSDHTDFVNLWIPFVNTDYPLAFLYDLKSSSYVTGSLIESIMSSPAFPTFRSKRSEMESRLVLVYRMM
eukprot:CAMPEP_0118657956 /NCGR_PEP_ID=MMETSP0785-20121206/14301_1 /TAXON_ID=91992 /ORGANISM="Bolidomonas pacifica, Strain CCMP 1866" /LENGTH=211 /DNA_ID=CAMNT_0006550921 /DNA_START=135 /DNA_END=767 /DNA_ORIENTATION=-